MPPGLDFAGRPQLVARVRGTGAGRSLLLNGHIDVVSAEPVEQWTTPPFRAEVRDGRLYGRGACDMKGGIAAMVFATERLVELGVTLAGDLLVATNTDEESSGAGGTAIVERSIRADAGIVTEPTGFDTWVSCRGSEYVVIRVPAGRDMPRCTAGLGRRRCRQCDREGNARARRDPVATGGMARPPGLRPSAALTTVATADLAAGEWSVTYPAACELTVAVMYLPVQADADGFGAGVRREVERGSGARPPTTAGWPRIRRCSTGSRTA